MSKIRVLFISGIPDDRMVKVVAVRKNGSLMYSPSGSVNAFNHVDRERIEPLPLMLDPNETQEIEIPRANVIFNQIADADSHRATLGKAAQIVTQLGNIPCINAPQAVGNTGRDLVFQSLSDISGLEVPRTERVTPADSDELQNIIEALDWDVPVIVRPCGKHTGIQTLLISGPDYYSELKQLTFPGAGMYLTQYRHSEHGDGVFRRVRIAMVDGQPMIRSAPHSRHWNVHAASREAADAAEFERLEAELINGFDEKILPGVVDALAELQRRIGLDFYGIDCDITDSGELLIYEVNANMNLLTVHRQQADATSAARARIAAALNQLIVSRAGQTQ
ncbi:MAG: ATP-grasp domain-containing protein [bacterium]